MKPDAMIVDRVRGILAKRSNGDSYLSDPEIAKCVKRIALKLQSVRDYGELTFRPTHGGWWELIYTTSKKSGRLNLQGFGPTLFGESSHGLYKYKDLRLIHHRLTRLGISKRIHVINHT